MVQPLSRSRTLDRRCQAFADHIEGFNLRTDGRHRRGRHDLASRVWRGPRNWDYRFCWLRDATFTLLAFMHLGYYEEAQMWRDWLIRAIAGGPRQVQIMYGVGGERWLPELVIPWLTGYENSSPVRIGNAAAQQLQLDVFGEVADAMFQALKAGMKPSERCLATRSVVFEHLATVWREPDEGIWEVRGERQHFVHSKVMAWVMFDRAANDVEADADLRRQWREIADEIHAEVCERGFDSNLNSFVQSYGSKRLDASLLQMPLVGFLPPSDPRIRGTLRAIEEKLRIENEFVLRYESEYGIDGFPAGEEPFSRVAFGSSTITCCKAAMTRPKSYSSVCCRAAMTWDCSPKNLIR